MPQCCPNVASMLPQCCLVPDSGNIFCFNYFCIKSDSTMYNMLPIPRSSTMISSERKKRTISIEMKHDIMHPRIQFWGLSD